MAQLGYRVIENLLTGLVKSESAAGRRLHLHAELPSSFFDARLRPLQPKGDSTKVYALSGKLRQRRFVLRGPRVFRSLHHCAIQTSIKRFRSPANGAAFFHGSDRSKGEKALTDWVTQLSMDPFICPLCSGRACYAGQIHTPASLIYRCESCGHEHRVISRRWLATREQKRLCRTQQLSTAQRSDTAAD